MGKQVTVTVHDVDGEDRLDDRMDVPFDLPIKINEVDTIGSIECGFRSDFFEGEFAGQKFHASSGSGCGNSWIVFSIGDRSFRMNARHIMWDLLEKITGERPPEPEGKKKRKKKRSK